MWLELLFKKPLTKKQVKEIIKKVAGNIRLKRWPNIGLREIPQNVSCLNNKTLVSVINQSTPKVSDKVTNQNLNFNSSKNTRLDFYEVKT